MKKLVFVAIVAAAASQAAGCIITSDDTGSNPVIIADITLQNGGPAGAIQCVPGDGLRVNAQLTGTASGFSDVYPCDVVALQTPELTSGYGEYTVWVDYINDRGLADPADWVVVETTNSQTVDVQADLHVTAVLTLNHGFFSLNWAINDSGGAPVTSCPPSGGDVSVLSTISGTTGGLEDLFNCTDGFNNPNPVYTAPLGLDDYVVDVSLLDTAGVNAIGSAPAENKSIINGNEYNDFLVTITLFP